MSGVVIYGGALAGSLGVFAYLWLDHAFSQGVHVLGLVWAIGLFAAYVVFGAYESRVLVETGKRVAGLKRQ